MFARNGGVPQSLLDLACGTGRLTRLLAAKGIEMIGVDGSAEMLCKAREADPEGSVLWICQDLRELDLYGTAGGAVSTLDSINHLWEDGDLSRFFDRLQYFIDPGGLFVLDANTVYKHLQVLGDHTFVYDTPDAYCVWQNHTCPEQVTTRISLDLFEREGEGYRRHREQFTERGYTPEQIFAAAGGFEPVAVYGDLTWEPPAADCERMVLVLKKQ